MSHIEIKVLIQFKLRKNHISVIQGEQKVRSSISSSIFFLSVQFGIYSIEVTYCSYPVISILEFKKDNEKGVTGPCIV